MHMDLLEYFIIKKVFQQMHFGIIKINVIHTKLENG